MKKPFLTTVLAVLVALTFVSCGGLASGTRQNTGSFSFAIDDAMLQNIARTADTNGTYTVKAHLFTSADSSYDQQKSISGTISFLKTQTLSFTNIPLNVELKLELEVLQGTSIIFTAAPQTFTLDSTNTTNITMAMYAALDTPYAIFSRSSNSNYILSSDTVFDDTTYSDQMFNIPGLLGMLPARYAIDRNNVAWYIGDTEDSEGNYFDAIRSASSTYSEENNEYDYNENPTAYIINIDEDVLPFYWNCFLYYDPAMNSISFVTATYADEQAYDDDDVENWLVTTYRLDELPEEITLQDSHTVTLKADPFLYNSESEPDFNDNSQFLGYTYNGNLYTMRLAGTDQTQPAVTVCKFSLETGSCVATTTVSLPVLAQGIESTRIKSAPKYEFNDIAVVDDVVYILFHQSASWISQATFWNKQGADMDYQPSEDIGYVDRGGIIVLNTANLVEKDYSPICAPEIKDVFEMKISDYADPVLHSFIYKDSALTTPIMTDYHMTFSSSWNDSPLLRNPEKIVAIKPKKLIIADNGSFMYTYGGERRDANGNLYCPKEITQQYGAKTTKQERLVVIDLENFSNSAELTVLEGSFYWEYTIINGYTATSRVQPASAYGPAVTDIGTNYYYNYGSSCDIISAFNEAHSDQPGCSFQIEQEFSLGNSNQMG